MRSYSAPRFLSAGWPLAIGILLTAAVRSPSIAAAGQLKPLDPGAVKVQGEIGRRIDLTVRANLLALDVEEDFLRPFREKNRTANLGHQGRYIGLGKLIDATVSFAAYTNDPQVLALKDRLIGELIKTQLPDGYMGVFQPQDRVFTLWDLHEMVYLIQGLTADYQRFGNKASLEAARKLADYIIKHRKGTQPPRGVGKLNTERALIALGTATANRQYLDYAVDGMDLRNWHSPVQGHAYTLMNVCLAQLDLYRLDPDEKLLAQSRRVIEFLRAGDGLMISGTCSRGEGFHSDQVVTGNLGETCATAYLIRLLHTMLSIEGTSAYGDLMERAIYNALFAAQLPDGRRLRYFTPLEGKRPVFEYDTYCCPNNFRRIIAELPQMVYYRTDDATLAVNLYTQSAATINLDNGLTLNVRQQTDYPNSGKVTIHLDPSQPAEFALRLRIPAWSARATIKVNGEDAGQPVHAGSFFTIRRQWKPGDRVQLAMPMPWRLIRGRKAQQGRVAVLRGPMLLCLDPKRIAGADLGQELQLKELHLDPRSLGNPTADNTVRPDGLACPLRAWSPGTPTTQPPDLNLLLSEFADPAGQATYFLVPDLSTAVDDELRQP